MSKSDPEVSGPDRRAVPPAVLRSGPGASAYDRLVDVVAEALCGYWDMPARDAVLNVARDEARVAVDAIIALLDDGRSQLVDHVVEFTDDGWLLEHPLSCRLEGLRHCRLNELCRDFEGPPAEGLGRYLAAVDDDGRLLLDRLGPDDGTDG